MTTFEKPAAVLAAITLTALTCVAIPTPSRAAGFEQQSDETCELRRAGPQHHGPARAHRPSCDGPFAQDIRADTCPDVNVGPRRLRNSGVVFPCGTAGTETALIAEASTR